MKPKLPNLSKLSIALLEHYVELPKPVSPNKSTFLIGVAAAPPVLKSPGNGNHVAKRG